MYELVYILPSKFDDEKCRRANKDVIKTITHRNGALVKDDFIGERNLQYPVKGHSKGKYYIIEFTIPVDHLDSLKKDLSLFEDIVRYLISKKEEVKERKKREGKEEKAKSEVKKPESKRSSPNKKDSRKKYSIVKSGEEQKAEDIKKKEKTTLDDLDKKLDEILD